MFFSAFPLWVGTFSHVVHDHNKTVVSSLVFQLIIFFGGLCEVLEHEHKQSGETLLARWLRTWFEVTWINFHKSAIVEKAFVHSWVSEGVKGVSWRLWACLSASYQRRSVVSRIGISALACLILVCIPLSLCAFVTPKARRRHQHEFFFIFLFISRFRSVSRDFDSFILFFPTRICSLQTTCYYTFRCSSVPTLSLIEASQDTQRESFYFCVVKREIIGTRRFGKRDFSVVCRFACVVDWKGEIAARRIKRREA